MKSLREIDGLLARFVGPRAKNAGGKVEAEQLVFEDRLLIVGEIEGTTARPSRRCASRKVYWRAAKFCRFADLRCRSRALNFGDKKCAKAERRQCGGKGENERRR